MNNSRKSTQKMSSVRLFDENAKQLLETNSKQNYEQETKAFIKKQIDINDPLLKYQTKKINKKEKQQFQQKDAFNTFYENSQVISQLSTYKKVRKISLIVLMVLFILFLLIGLIKPYDGICPKNSTCRVFSHCHQGFQYDQNIKHCVLKNQLIQKVQIICQNTIKQLKNIYGNSQCQQQFKYLPNKHIDDIVVSLPKQTRQNLWQKLQKYFSNKSHQQKLQFTFRNNRVLPNTKQLSNFCKIINFFKSRQFKIPFIFILFLICSVLAIYTYFLPSLKIKRIYQELKKKTLDQRKINVTFMKQQLQNQYGQISQIQWKLIDKMRRQQQQIDLVFDKFWYWTINY